jgi:hypothetical protein
VREVREVVSSARAEVSSGLRGEGERERIRR